MFFTTVEDFSPHAKQEKNDYICYLIVNLLLYVLVNSNAKNANIIVLFQYDSIMKIYKIIKSKKSKK
jgi:hypothetical protein